MLGSASEGGTSVGGGGSEAIGGSSIMSGGGGGDYFEGDRSTGGNRWPRQETLALLKIRSDMDGAFRDANLKGPLWEEVSRKLAELGYHRNSKKCKEKFENVYKYHKRTKDGRVGKSDGKTYRFFDQLEALDQHHASLSPGTPRARPLSPVQAPVPVQMVFPAGTSGTSPAGVTVTSSPYPMTITSTPQQVQPQVNVVQQQSYQHQQNPVPVHHSSPIQMENPSSPSDDTLSTSSTSSDEEVLGGRKRKRKWKDFFEGLMKDVIDKQEQLQKRFLEAVEKREHDRFAREEVWKEQEMGRLNREHEILIRERSMAAAKDAALIELLQKLSDQHQIPLPYSIEVQPQPQPQIQTPTPIRGVVPVVTSTTTTITSMQPPPPQSKPVLRPHQPQSVLRPQPISQPQEQVQATQIHVHETPVVVPISMLPQSQPVQPQPPQQLLQPRPLTQIPPQPKPLTQIPPQPAPQQSLVLSNTTNTNVDIHESNNGGDNQHHASSSRWPKAEVEALINLRTKLDEKYQENGPKGPLWEEISAAMKGLGYNRNAKRCKEKWENINKYFKKVKESNKKRPEDSKTCPYFHQLDALYRKKATYTQPQPKPENLNTMGPIMAAQPEQRWPPAPEQGAEDLGSGGDSDDDGDDEDDDDQGNGYEIVANNGGNNNNNSGVHSITAATTSTA